MTYAVSEMLLDCYVRNTFCEIQAEFQALLNRSIGTWRILCAMVILETRNKNMGGRG
jgi:hypothetical protein